jgi:hypothetical protein
MTFGLEAELLLVAVTGRNDRHGKPAIANRTYKDSSKVYASRLSSQRTNLGPHILRQCAFLTTAQNWAGHLKAERLYLGLSIPPCDRHDTRHLMSCGPGFS